MRVRVFYHDRCFDGACSAALFSRFYRERIRADAEFVFSGLLHRAGVPARWVTGDEVYGSHSRLRTACGCRGADSVGEVIHAQGVTAPRETDQVIHVFGIVRVTDAHHRRLQAFRFEDLGPPTRYEAPEGY